MFDTIKILRFFAVILLFLFFMSISFLTFEFFVYKSKNDYSLTEALTTYGSYLTNSFSDSEDMSRITDDTIYYEPRKVKQPFQHKNSYSKVSDEKKVYQQPNNISSVEFSFLSKVLSFKYNSTYAYLEIEHKNIYTWVQIPKSDFEAYSYYIDNDYYMKGVCYQKVNNNYYRDCNFDFYKKSELNY